MLFSVEPYLSTFDRVIDSAARAASAFADVRERLNNKQQYYYLANNPAMRNPVPASYQQAQGDNIGGVVGLTAITLLLYAVLR